MSSTEQFMQNIMDECIPESVKNSPLQALPSDQIPSQCKHKAEKRKASENFDQLHVVPESKIRLSHTDLLPLVAANQSSTTPPVFSLLKEAGIVRAYRAILPIGHFLEADALSFTATMKPKTTALIETELDRVCGVKFTLVLTAELEKPSLGLEQDNVEDKPHTIATAYFRSDAAPILNAGEIRPKVDEAIAKMLKNLEDFTNQGSGWQLKRCVALDLGIVQYHPFRGRSYIKTPAYVPPRSVINVKNQDNRCFEWAILSALHPVAKDPQRSSKYQDHLGELKFTGINFPVLADEGTLSKFERQNPGLSLNVFGWKDGPYPLYMSKQEGCEIDLLLLTDSKNPNKKHYVWVKNLPRLLHKNSMCSNRKHPCRKCLHVFSSEALLEGHKKDCNGIGKKPQRTVMPNDGENILRFQSHHKQMRVPFIIYADFEALNTPVHGAAMDVKESNTRLIAEQKPCSFCYVVVRCDGESNAPVLYRGENAVEKFLHCLQVELNSIREQLRHPAEMLIVNDDDQTFKDAILCHICGEPLGEDRVRDHCHITGKFRGAAHSACNLKLRIYPNTVKVPVVLHNLRGYDGHLIMQALGYTEVTGKLGCIPNNMEKYMTFSVGQLQFIDSLQFLNSSLDKLSGNLQPEDLKATTRYNDEGKLRLLRRKGVYPYEYVDSFERFTETQLPTTEAFYSSLTREHISDKDYEHAKQIWTTFRCKTLGDYHDLYLRTDVLLLADVFEKFRDTAQQHYGLDPANYFSLPGMSWDALLKNTKIKLELLTDIDQHLFMERGLRGGTCMASKRFAKANNPACPDYDPSQPTSSIVYLDANNLYGWAMSQPLPTGAFRWDSPELSEVLKTEADAEEGWILEVDLEYPEELHISHSDYPLAVETINIPEHWLSDYQHALMKKLGIKFTECTKQVPNLCKKERYVTHYRNLTLYYSLGMQITKIHRALKFKQEAWMKPYIEMNTRLRAASKSDFDKDFFKLANNSVFGKTMENLRKRIRVDLVRSSEEDRLRRLMADPAYQSNKIFSGGLIAVHSVKSKLKLNRPVYIGQAVLDLSKYLMYEFWYNQIKAQYGERAQLLYTDTDSLLFEVETENIYADMAMNGSSYDFSDYPTDHPCHSTENKKVLGKFKDECNGRVIAELVVIRPKMYSILEASGASMKKAKGVQRITVKQDLRHELYKQALFKREEMKHTQVFIRSHGHMIGVYKQNKTSLSPMDTKKWIAADGITTYAYGHIGIERGKALSKTE